LALQWKAQGAGIIGGCCGIGPDDIDLLSKHLADPVTSTSESTIAQTPATVAQKPLPAWTDKKGREL